MCFLVPRFFHLAYCFQDFCMLYHVSVLHWSKVFCGNRILFSGWGHLDCFHLLGIMNYATINICAQRFCKGKKLVFGGELKTCSRWMKTPHYFLELSSGKFPPYFLWGPPIILILNSYHHPLSQADSWFICSTIAWHRVYWRIYEDPQGRMEVSL